MDREALRQALAAHLEYYAELGIDGWRTDSTWAARAADSVFGTSSPDANGPSDSQSRVESHATPVPTTSVTKAGPTSEAGPITEAGGDPVAALDALRAEIGPDCTRCKLHTLGRRQVVFGVGNPRAALMFAGEAPGRDEDQQGEPFVGRAGQLLTKIIEAMGFSRGDVYIANVIKCRPPENRNPEPDEVATCQPFLFRQIDIVQPKVIVALGTFATQSLLETKDPISRLRGRVWSCRGTSLVPTFHPAFLLRSPERKRDTWDDMKIVMGLLNGEA